MHTKIIKIGTQCNNNCLDCSGRDKIYTQDLKIICAELELGREQQCEQVIFTGREPTLLSDFPEILLYARDLGFKTIQVVSNARMFAYKAFAEQCVQSGMTELLVPIYHNDPAIHDSITRNENSFSQAITGIKNIQDFSRFHFPYYGVSISAHIVLYPENQEHIVQIHSFFKSIGIAQVFILNNKRTPVNNEIAFWDSISSMTDDPECKVFLYGFQNIPDSLKHRSYEQYVTENQNKILTPL